MQYHDFGPSDLEVLPTFQKITLVIAFEQRESSSFIFHTCIPFGKIFHVVSCPDLNGLPGASSNRIFRLYVRQSVRPSFHLSIIPSHLQSAISKVWVLKQ